jgi:hypothetical protein
MTKGRDYAGVQKIPIVSNWMAANDMGIRFSKRQAFYGWSSRQFGVFAFCFPACRLIKLVQGKTKNPLTIRSKGTTISGVDRVTMKVATVGFEPTTKGL